MATSANLFSMTEDVDFDPELYVIKLKDQLIRADDEYQRLKKDLQGLSVCYFVTDSGISFFLLFFFSQANLTHFKKRS